MNLFNAQSNENEFTQRHTYFICSVSGLLALAEFFLSTCAVLCVEKVTASPFSSALYLLLLLGKCFRVGQLRTSTIYYHKEEEKWRQTGGREEAREGICGGERSERGVYVFVRQTESLRSSVIFCKSKATMRYEHRPRIL